MLAVSSTFITEMLQHQESSASLPLSLGSADSTGGGPSWLESSRSSSLASSVSDGGSVDSQSKKSSRDLPLWRSFFAGRSRSVPESAPASPSAEAPSPTFSGPRELWNGSPEEQTASLYEPSISEKSMTSTRTSFFKGRWTSSRQSRERRSSVHSTHDDSDEPASRSSSRAGKSRKDSASRTLSLRELSLSWWTCDFTLLIIRLHRPTKATQRLATLQLSAPDARTAQQQFKRSRLGIRNAWFGIIGVGRSEPVDDD